jgi:flagellar biosynthetic protein FliR
MDTLSVSQLSEQWIFMVAIVFARIGTAMMILPAFGDNNVPMRPKIMIALMVSLGLMPALAAPPVPASAAGFGLVMIVEATVGAFIGCGARILMAALHLLGAQIGFAASLSNSLTPTQGNSESGSAIASLLTMGAVACLFVTNAHHVILAGLMRSYAVFPPGQIMIGDMAQQIARLGGSAFYIAATVGAPFFVITLLLNLGMGLANRVMPAMQVFFVMSPGLIMMGIGLLSLAVPAILFFQLNQLTIWFENFVR